MPAAPVVESPGPDVSAPTEPDISPSSPPPGPSSPTSAPSEDDLMSDSFGDLETISKPKPKPIVQPPAKPNEAKPKPEAEEEKQELQKTEQAKDGKQPNKTATLRTAYENTKRENYELKQQLEQAKQGRPAEDPRVKTYQERLEAAEKRREELENEIRFSAYERSDDYKKQHQKPFDDAWAWGRESTARLKVLQEDGSSRVGTPQDFDKIMLITDDGDAIDAAEAMFGNKARVVLDHRWELKKLDAARYRAIEDFRSQNGQRQQQMTETEAKQREHIGKMWGELNNEAAERFPKWFKPEDGDEDGNKLLEEGYKLADTAFSKGNGKSPEEMVRLHASIRNRAAAFTREVYRNSKLSERVSELEKQLAEFQASEPGPGEGGGPGVVKDEFEELKADA